MIKQALILITILSTLAMGQIAGSKHDFSAKNWNTTGEICVVCHTPHSAKTGVVGAPLWNHQVTTATFTTYSTSTLDATVGQPGGSSKLCLSCHDGTVAVDNFNATTNGTDFVGGKKDLTTDLSNDHPVSFAYTSALATADGELYDPSTAVSGLGSTIADDMLIGGNMECASCHDVHNTSAVSGTKLLIKSNSSSALCLTCHNK